MVKHGLEGDASQGATKRQRRPVKGKKKNSEPLDRRAAFARPDGPPKESNEKRLPKRKVAVFYGYNGTGYSGSQINPGAKTVEGALFKAFVQSGAISEDNATSHQKVGLMRAARTDAGVHAAVNVIALKLILAPADMQGTLEEHINSFLPPAIRVWSIIPVQGSFSPRTLCDYRTYEYTLPTHVFLGPKPESLLYKHIAASREKLPTDSTETLITDSWEDCAAFWSKVPTGNTLLQDLEEKRKWRVTSALLSHARDFVKAYEGSHNFHNFTVGKDFRDRSCQRVMKQLTISEPFLVNGFEYVSVNFVGQSFMLHQIRKMIGLMILAVRTSTPPSLVAETYGPARIHIPKAPALGLLLLQPVYSEYNKKIVAANTKANSLQNSGKMTQPEAEMIIKPCLEVGPELEKRVQEFKNTHVYPRMFEMEEKDAIFSKWLTFMDVYDGADFHYLNCKGVIPQAAIFKKDENPEKSRKQNPVESDTEQAQGEEEG